jgi:KDO2-lipid IV(A) lauroyltransferase
MIRKISNERRDRSLSKYVQYLLARGLISVLQWTPLPLANGFGRFMGWVCWRLLKRRRAVVRANLEVVNASLNGSAYHGMSLDEQVREVFLRNGANLICGFRLSRMPVERQARHIKIEGVDYSKGVLAEGEGMIILLAHMGPWESLSTLGALFERAGIKTQLGAIYRPFNNDYLEDWYRDQRERLGTRMFSRRQGIFKPADHLRAGGVLGVFGDQKMREGVEANFFGRRVKTNPLPAIFHRRTGAAIFGVSFFQESPYQWVLSFKPCICSGEHIDQSSEYITEICNQAAEVSLGESVLDGFWLTPRF